MAEDETPETGAIDWAKTGLISLREVIERIRHEHIAAKRSKREISHDLANGFLYTLLKWAKALVEPSRSANYFCLEIDGVVLGVTPFGSHEEWWYKPSEGFRQLIKARACRWGVVLFHIKRKDSWEGLWIEGPDFDKKVLKGRERVSSSMISEARRKRIMHSFTESEQFVNYIKHPPKEPGEPYLIRKPGK